MTFVPEETDLAQLASDLRRIFADKPPIGYLPGKTALRDAVVSSLRCSQLDAELVVDTMISGGYLRYSGDPAGEIDDLRPWSISGAPGSS